MIILIVLFFVFLLLNDSKIKRFTLKKEFLMFDIHSGSKGFSLL